MTDILKTTNLMKARGYLQDVIDFNRGSDLGQYNYIYIARLKDGYMVRITQKKPTTKNSMYVYPLDYKGDTIRKNMKNAPVIKTPIIPIKTTDFISHYEEEKTYKPNQLIN